MQFHFTELFLQCDKWQMHLSMNYNSKIMLFLWTDYIYVLPTQHAYFFEAVRMPVWSKFWIKNVYLCFDSQL